MGLISRVAFCSEPSMHSAQNEFSINYSMLPSICYTVIYMVRAGINTVLHTDGNVLSLTACQNDTSAVQWSLVVTSQYQTSTI